MLKNKNRSSVKKILVKIAIGVIVLFVLTYLWFMLFHDHENSHGNGTSAQGVEQNDENPPPGQPGHQHGAGYAQWIAGKKSAQIDKMFTVIEVAQNNDLVKSYLVAINPVAKEFFSKDFRKAARQSKLRKQKLIDVSVDGQDIEIYSRISWWSGQVKFVFDALDNAQFITSYGNLYPGADYTVSIVSPTEYYLSVEDGSGQAQYWRVNADGVTDISLLIQEKFANKFANYKQFPSFTLQFAQNAILFDEVRYCCEEFHPTNSKPKSFQIAYDDL